MRWPWSRHAETRAAVAPSVPENWRPMASAWLPAPDLPAESTIVNVAPDPGRPGVRLVFADGTELTVDADSDHGRAMRAVTTRMLPSG